MTTRSTTLGVFASSGAKELTAVFTCPNATTALFKSAQLLSFNVAPIPVSLYVSRSVPAVTIALFSGDLQERVVFDWEGWMVLETGDQILVGVVAPQVFGWFSGALLPVAA